MLHLAIENLLQERGRLLISSGGVAAALILVLLLEGVFAGTSEQIVAYPQKTDADVWVMQEGVSNMHMAISILPGELEETVRDVPGVGGLLPSCTPATSWRWVTDSGSPTLWGCKRVPRGVVLGL